MMKKIKKTLLYLFGFAALLLVITVIINLPAFDEELLPEVAAIKNIKAEPYSLNNAYPALVAINAPSGKSLHEAAEEVRVFLNQKIETTGIDYLNNKEYNTLIGKNHDNSWQNIYNSCNSRTDISCMEKLHRELLVQPISDERLIEQIVRYNDFIQYPEFKEVSQLDLEAPFGPYGPLINLKRLFIAEAYANQTPETYLYKVFQDVTFWRQVLGNSNYLLTKMIAVATLSDDISSLSAAIKRGHLNTEQMKAIQQKMSSLSTDEIDLGRVFEFELKFGITMIDSIEEENNFGNSFDKLFYQPQATHNFNYLLTTKPLKKIAALNTAEFYQYIQTDQQAEDFKSPVSWSPSMLYNYVGKIMVGYAIPAYTNYIGRVHDLNGMFYLLKLQIEIALNPGRPVKQVISQSKYTNPYTLKPMSYNPDTHNIYFKCMDKTSSCELDL